MISERLQDLEKLLAAAEHGVEKIDALNALATELLEQDPTRSRQLAEQALQLNYSLDKEGHSYLRGNVEALITLGELANRSDAYGRALTSLMEAYTLLKGQLFPDLLANAADAIGWAHFRLGNYTEALDFMDQALGLYRELLNRDKEAALLTSLGTLYSRMGRHEQAMENFQRALLLQDSQHLTRARGVTLNNMATAQVVMGANDESVKNAQAGLQIFRELDLRPLEARAFDTLGKAYFGRGDLDLAREALTQCLLVSQKFHFNYLEMEALLGLGKIYMRQEQRETALHHFLRAVKKAETYQLNKYLFEFHQVLARLYEERGDMKNALQHYKQYHTTMDLAMEEASSYRVENLKALHQVEKKQKESEVLQLQNQALEKEINERLRERIKLERLATTDSLTELYNRRHFFTLGEYELEKARKGMQPLCVIFVDIDHFKLVNDNYSHLAGDKILIELANLFLDFTQNGGVCCRYGGEEFLILLPATPLAAGLDMAERIRQKVNDRHFLFGSQEIRITTSLGIVQADTTDLNLEALLARADQALYRAKFSGRNRVST